MKVEQSSNFAYRTRMDPDTIITLIVADDHPLMVSGIRSTLDQEKDIRIVGTATDGNEALDQIRDLGPHLALLDIQMPGMNGLEVARAARSENLAAFIVFLTMHDNEELFNEAMDLDVRGYVLKDSLESDLVSAIRLVAREGLYVSPWLLGHVIDRKKSEQQLHSQNPGFDTLTDAERKILRLVAESLTTSEIAQRLNLSSRTISNHRTHICAKLRLSGSYSLLKFALENRHSLA